MSTEKQKEEGTIAIQQSALQEYSEAKGYELVRVFSDEGVSGSKDLDNRPELSEMLDCLESHAEVSGILIFKLDRLARDLYIQGHLLRKLKT